MASDMAPTDFNAARDANMHSNLKRKKRNCKVLGNLAISPRRVPDTFEVTPETWAMKKVMALHKSHINNEFNLARNRIHYTSIDLFQTPFG